MVLLQSQRVYSEMFGGISVAFVKVLLTPDKWFGVTYQEDKDCVKKELLKFLEEGVYPNKLF